MDIVVMAVVMPVIPVMPAIVRLTVVQEQDVCHIAEDTTEEVVVAVVQLVVLLQLLLHAQDNAFVLR